MHDPCSPFHFLLRAILLPVSDYVIPSAEKTTTSLFHQVIPGYLSQQNLSQSLNVNCSRMIRLSEVPEISHMQL